MSAERPAPPPEDMPMTIETKLDPTTVEDFCTQIQRLTESPADPTEDIYHEQRWFYDVTSGNIIDVIRFLSRRDGFDGHTINIYERPHKNPDGTLSQIHRHLDIDHMRPSYSKARIRLNVFDYDTGDHVYDKDNALSHNIQSSKVGLSERVRQRFTQHQRESAQKRDNVHLDDMPPVDSNEAEFLAVLPLLHSLELNDMLDESRVGIRPVHLAGTEI